MALVAVVTFLIVCSAVQPALAQQQRFRVRPSNTSVVEGETAVLSCEVDHQVGELQWAKEGFAMGYDRELPGHPRYRVVGDADAGVHNLEITNVTLEDDALFQCQVSPNRGQRAIRAAAYLTVILRPVSVAVTSTVRSPRDGVFEIRAGNEITLTCDVTGAKPAATVRWQRNGVTIEPDQDVSFSEADSPERNDTSSSITLTSSYLDDGAGYSCLASHPAVPADRQDSFNSTVRLSVLYAPNPPEITGYDEGEIVRMDDEITLTCISRNGNPLAELVWFKNGEPITYQYRTIRHRAISEYTFTAASSDLGTVYRCEASTFVHPEPMVTSVVMNVLFGPETVEVEGTEEAQRGEEIEMSCETSNSNPPANITWVMNGRTVLNTTQAIELHEEGGWVSTSNLTATIPINMREDMVVSCYALNPSLGINGVGTTKVTVLYPPKKPRILGYVPGTHLISGQSVSLSCLAQGGNPAASLTWYKGDQEKSSDTDVEDDVARNALTFSADYRDNEAVYRCDSSNPVLDEPDSVNVTLLVYYPPPSLKLKVKPKKLKARRRVTITCESRPSNPAANLSWWRDSELVTQGVSNVTSKPSGDHGGFVSKLRLRKRLKWTDDQAVYTCRSQVSVLPGNMHDAVTLHVAFRPVFTKRSVTEDITMGESVLLNFTARASPDNITYRWVRNDKDLPSADASVVGIGPLLNISEVAKADTGLYKLEAENSEGISKMEVTINVQYPPEVTTISRELLVAPGATAVLECEADANPTTDDMITWEREGFTFDDNKTKSFYSNGTSFLTVYDAREEDIGEFLCVVDNGMGDVNATAGLLVEHAPEIDTSPQYLKAAAEKGATAQITCRARGAPNVTFEWSREGVAIDGKTDADKYSIQYTREDLITWQSVLDVTSVVTADYGAYVCVARNELNFQRQEIELGGTTSPDPPIEVKALNVSHNSVTLSWTPGFDGGLIQRYRIRYTETTGEERFSYQDVQPENATVFTVELLRPNTQYSFSIQAYNDLGESGYTKDVVKAKTIDGPGVRLVPADDGDYGRDVISRLVIAAVTLIGVVLFIINVLLITCYVRRRQSRRKTGSSGVSTKTETLPSRGDDSDGSVTTADEDSYSADETADTYQDASSSRGYGPGSETTAGYGARPWSPASTAYSRTGRGSTARRAAYGPGPYRRPAATPDLLAGGGGPYYPESLDLSDWGEMRGQSQQPRLALLESPPPVRGATNFEQRGHLV